MSFPVGMEFRGENWKKVCIFPHLFEGLQQPQYCKIQRTNLVLVTWSLCIVLKVVVMTEMYVLPS